MNSDPSEDVDRLGATRGPRDASAPLAPAQPIGTLPEVPRLAVEVKDWFEPDADKLKREYFALVRRLGVPQNLSVELNAPRYLELRRFVEAQAEAAPNPGVAADQRRELASAASAVESTERWCALLLVKMSERYGISNALRACQSFLRLQLARVVKELAAYQVAGGDVLCEESLEWYDSRRLLPTLAQFVYGHARVLEVIVGDDPYTTTNPDTEKVYLPLERVENDGSGGIITNMWESAVNLPMDVWVEYVVPQLTAMRARGFNSYHVWTPAETHYVTEGVVWEGEHSSEFAARRIGGTRHSVLEKKTHLSAEATMLARRYLELITDPPVQHSGPFHLFNPEADLPTISALGDEVIGSIVAVDERTWRAPSVWHAAAWLMNIAGGAAEGKEIYPRSEGHPPGVSFQEALLFHGTADTDADLIPSLFMSDDRGREGEALVRFMLAMEAVNETGKLPTVTADAYVGVGNHYGLSTYLIPMNLDPLVAVSHAVREAEPGAEVVVYWMAFDKITSLGGKVSVPPPWAERVQAQKELFVDFNDVNMTDVKGECSWLLFPAEGSYLDFEFLLGEDEPDPDERWFEAARRWAAESPLEVADASVSEVRRYADELYRQIGSPHFIDAAFISRHAGHWRARFADLLKWLMLKRGEQFYISCAPVRLLLPHTLGLLAWFAQGSGAGDETSPGQDDADVVRQFMNAVRMCLEHSEVGGE
jgi:hypothetical protein